MSRTTESWEIITDPEALRALEPEWDELWARAGEAYVSQRFAWCWAGWTAVSQPLGRRLHCVVARSDGKLVLVWPFVVHRRTLWARARPLGPEVAEYTSVLVERDEHTAGRVADAWATLCRTIRCDAILLPYVPVGSVLHRFISARRGPALSDTTPISSTRCEGDADAAEIAKMIGSKSLGRHRRKLDKLGTVRFERITDPAKRAAMIEWTLYHKEQRVVSAGGHALWNRTTLYRDFLSAVGVEDGLEIIVLTLDGAPVASCVARLDKVRFEQFLSAYDPRFKEYSPGQLLRIHNMAWVIERGLEYDLRVGEQEYKKDWTNRHGAAVSYNIPISAWGRVAVAMRELQRALARTPRLRAAAHGGALLGF